RLEKVDTLVIDKTGTLTEGKPRLTSVEVLDDTSDLEALGSAAALEQGSEHSLAAAIIGGARDRGATIPAVEDFSAEPGRHGRCRGAGAWSRRCARRGAPAGETRGHPAAATRRTRRGDGG